MSHQRQFFIENQFFKEKRVMKGDEWKMFSISLHIDSNSWKMATEGTVLKLC
jgi:hypothetical protein